MTRKRRDPHALGAKQRKAGVHRSKRRKIKKAIDLTELKLDLHGVETSRFNSNASGKSNEPNEK